MQHVGIIMAFCLPGGTCFSVPGGTKKLLGCGLQGGEGISTQADTVLSNELNFLASVHIYKIHLFDGALPLNISP